MAGPKPTTTGIDDATPMPGMLRAAPSSVPPPVDFGQVAAAAFRSGGTLDGEPVTDVRIRTSDGEWRGVKLPEPVAAAKTEEPAIRWSPTKRRIMAALKNERTAITRTRLGQIIRRDVEGGRVLSDINYLKENGLLTEDDGLITDDPKKLPSGS